MTSEPGFGQKQAFPKCSRKHFFEPKNIRIYLRSKWLLELPDLEIFLSTLDFFQREKIIFCQNAYFCLKMIFRPCFIFFPY